MRQIGTLTDARQAEVLAAYLFTLGIRSQLESDPEGIQVWALDEDRIPQAREEFQRFVQDPNDGRYVSAETQALKLHEQLAQKDRQRQRNIVSVKGRWNMPSTKGLTFALIVISCAAWFATDFGERPDNQIRQSLLIDRYIDANGIPMLKPAFSPRWDVLHGQIWRLITPIFLHFGPMHLIMNMMALHSLGKLIEARFGTLKLARLVALIAVVSNLSQYAWTGTGFGGMSGVVFGLFGYVWIRSEFDPAAGFRITRSSITMMLGWMVLCFTGLVGPIANAAHVVGLVAGILLGYGPVLSGRIFRR
jgi:GlpG protein